MNPERMLQLRRRTAWYLLLLFCLSTLTAGILWTLDLRLWASFASLSISAIVPAYFLGSE